MTETRSSDSYLLLEPGMFITSRFAHQLLKLTNVNDVRTRRRGFDPDFDAQGLALRRLAMSFERGSGPVLDIGSVKTQKPEPAGELSSRQASELLGITTRAVVRAIDEQRLPARKHGKRWAIHRMDVEDYRSSMRRKGK